MISKPGFLGFSTSGRSNYSAAEALVAEAKQPDSRLIQN